LCCTNDKDHSTAVSFGQFLKLLPSLNNPYALAGYLVVAIVWFGYALARAKLFARLSPKQTSDKLNLIFKYAFWLSIVAISLGFGYRAYVEANRNPLKQQGGDCSVVQNGSGNTASSNCENKPAGAK
jgi:hypothetical protein